MPTTILVTIISHYFDGDVSDKPGNFTVVFFVWSGRTASFYICLYPSQIWNTYFVILLRKIHTIFLNNITKYFIWRNQNKLPETMIKCQFTTAYFINIFCYKCSIGVFLLFNVYGMQAYISQRMNSSSLYSTYVSPRWHSSSIAREILKVNLLN